MPTPNEILKQYWGYDHLKPAQELAIKNVLQNKNVVALLPTGGGKSVCFQVPALLKEGLCIVVSPLVSLMQDQVDNLKRKGIKAMMLAGYIPYKELLRQLDNCMYGNYKFLYLSPERLQNDLVKERIKGMNINLIAIDEAHCISQWGHDFRPAYRDIPLLKELHPKVPCIALTATATKEVLTDIQENLELEPAKIIKISFERKNISLLIKKSEDKNFELQRFFKNNTGVSIIYVRSRKLTLHLKEFLNNHNISAEAYHGGLNSKQKENLLKNWQAEHFKVMVATNAFGMGIDKANVRNVVHYHLPDSLEAYYQEVGRAGRDGKPAKAFLLYNNADILQLKDQFLKNAPTLKATQFIYKKLNSYFSIAYGEGQETKHNFNFLDFCHTYKINTYVTHNVLQFLDRLDVLSLSKEFQQRTALFFKIPNQQLYAFLEENPGFKKLIHTMLRMQGGFFEYKTKVNLRELKSRTGYNKNKINGLLKKLEKLEIIDLTLADQDSTVEFLVPREDERTINPLTPYLKKYYTLKKNKINKVVSFIENRETCRVTALLNYFGETKEKACGHCSVCKMKKWAKRTKNENLKELRKAINIKLNQEEATSKQLMEELNFSEENILFVLNIMLDRKEISLTPKKTYEVNK